MYIILLNPFRHEKLAVPTEENHFVNIKPLWSSYIFWFPTINCNWKPRRKLNERKKKHIPDKLNKHFHLPTISLARYCLKMLVFICLDFVPGTLMQSRARTWFCEKLYHWWTFWEAGNIITRTVDRHRQNDDVNTSALWNKDNNVTVLKACLRFY